MESDCWNRAPSPSQRPWARNVHYDNGRSYVWPRSVGPRPHVRPGVAERRLNAQTDGAINRRSATRDFPPPWTEVHHQGLAARGHAFTEESPGYTTLCVFDLMFPLTGSVELRAEALTLSHGEREQQAPGWCLADGRSANSGARMIERRWTFLPLPRGWLLPTSCIAGRRCRLGRMGRPLPGCPEGTNDNSPRTPDPPP